MIAFRSLTVPAVLACFTLSLTDSASSEPYLPTDDAQVLERLSFKVI